MCECVLLLLSFKAESAEETQPLEWAQGSSRAQDILSASSRWRVVYAGWIARLQQWLLPSRSLPKSYCFSFQGSLGGKALSPKRQKVSIVCLLQKPSFVQHLMSNPRPSCAPTLSCWFSMCVLGALLLWLKGVSPCSLDPQPQGDKALV